MAWPKGHGWTPTEQGKSEKKLFFVRQVESNRINLRWIPTRIQLDNMPQVICNLEKADHDALKLRAKANFRTVGRQLVAEAMQKAGLPVPRYIDSRPTSKKKGGAK